MPNNMTIPEWESIYNRTQDKLETLKLSVNPENAYAINSVLYALIRLSDNPEILKLIDRFATTLHEETRMIPQPEISEIIDHALDSIKETLAHPDGIRQLQKK